MPTLVGERRSVGDVGFFSRRAFRTQMSVPFCFGGTLRPWEGMSLGTKYPFLSTKTPMREELGPPGEKNRRRGAARERRPPFFDLIYLFLPGGKRGLVGRSKESPAGKEGGKGKSCCSWS